ncbi:hypothetical protein E2C01_075630 [Portunus trituberculatus]|uniref:Uncharacterized protein n=1 Tax=Portunus trituberculatus TaxID=210409 RepID=A0A5B7I930_PORTR|nr:hypothetical protein [Portunus trituberculatus]
MPGRHSADPLGLISPAIVPASYLSALSQSRCPAAPCTSGACLLLFLVPSACPTYTRDLSVPRAQRPVSRAPSC